MGPTSETLLEIMKKRLNLILKILLPKGRFLSSFLLVFQNCSLPSPSRSFLLEFEVKAVVSFPSPFCMAEACSD